MGAFDTANTLTYPGRPPADIRLIYDRLIVASADERASYYGMLAEGIRVGEDFRRISFALHPDARWHDGRPVRAADVAFTFETLKEKGAPFYRQAFGPLRIVIEDENVVVIANDRAGDRDVIRRISTIPIHPEHVWSELGDDAVPAETIGSGPYRVVALDAPRRLVLERVEGYWAQQLPVNMGRWNADRLVFDYFRDASVALEAFRADEYDVRSEDNPTFWQSGYSGPDLETGAIQRAEFQSQGVGDLHGIVFNLRRSVLADRRVRLAMALAYDFESANQTLFAGAYQPFTSVFGQTALAARGSASDAEAVLITQSGAEFVAEALDTPDPMARFPASGSREALAAATDLIAQAGLQYRQGRLIDPETDRPLALQVVSPNPLYERALGWIENSWDRLGISLVRRQTDRAAASRQLLDRDFDLATLSWSPAQLPGTAERLLWHSDLAEAPGSYALSGLKSVALDRTIEALETARSEDGLLTAGRAFDRVFRHSMALLPLWRSSTIRLAWWNRFGRPPSEIA
ncbi:MAG: extracellular solute-binding protein, partial [Pseudomonadota bacterium]